MPTDKRPLKVFLCHAHADRDAVRALYTRLTNDGVDAWLDKEKLLPGQDWELEIKKAVREADVVVVCLSKQFNQAGFRQKEVRLALDTAMEKPEGEIFIIPARLEECEPFESLKKWHWVDLFDESGYSTLIRTFQVRANELDAILKKESLPQSKVNIFSNAKDAVLEKDFISTKYKKNRIQEPENKKSILQRTKSPYKFNVRPLAIILSLVSICLCGLGIRGFSENFNFLNLNVKEITLRVVDDNGEPVRAARVVLLVDSDVLPPKNTDSNGVVVFKVLSRKEIRVFIEAENYQPSDNLIIPSNSNDVEFECTLKNLSVGTRTLYIKIVDAGQDMILSGTRVTLQLNDQEYTQFSDLYGVAQFSLPSMAFSIDDVHVILSLSINGFDVNQKVNLKLDSFQTVTWDRQEKTLTVDFLDAPSP